MMGSYVNLGQTNAGTTAPGTGFKVFSTIVDAMASIELAKIGAKAAARPSAPIITAPPPPAKPGVSPMMIAGGAAVIGLGVLLAVLMAKRK